jgi:hypothetical protein
MGSKTPDKIRLFFTVSALASWSFFVLMGYLSFTYWEDGIIVFWAGTALFLCIGLFLLGISVWNGQARVGVPGVIVLAPVLLCGLHVQEKVGEIGSRDVPLTFRLVDQENHQPILNALVRIVSTYDEATEPLRKSEGRTGVDGGVRLMPELTFTHTREAFRDRGNIRFWDQRLEIIAEGYQPLSSLVSEHTGEGIPLHAGPPPPVTIALKKSKRLPEAEEVRTAILKLLEGDIEGKVEAADGREIEAVMKSKARLQCLRNDPITSDGAYTFIGNWTCVLGERTCFTVIRWPGGSEYTVRAKIEGTDKEGWKVSITRVEHANLGMENAFK